MNTNKLLSTALAAAALAGTCLPAAKISAQAEFGNRFTPTIQLVADGDTDGTRQRTIQSGIMDPIGLFPNEQIGINLVLPSDRSNSPVGIFPLDGGDILGSENLYVASNGTAHFSFKGGSTRGLYRVLVIVASDQYRLQFYVSDFVPNGCTPP